MLFHFYSKDNESVFNKLEARSFLDSAPDATFGHSVGGTSNEKGLSVGMLEDVSKVIEHWQTECSYGSLEYNRPRRTASRLWLVG